MPSKASRTATHETATHPTSPPPKQRPHETKPSFTSCRLQVPTIIFVLPPTTAASAKQMFKVFDDGKLRVRDPLHKRFEGSQVKALDSVIQVNGNAMDPQVLLNACVGDEAVVLKLQRDRNKQ